MIRHLESALDTSIHPPGNLKIMAYFQEDDCFCLEPLLSDLSFCPPNMETADPNQQLYFFMLISL